MKTFATNIIVWLFSTTLMLSSCSTASNNRRHSEEEIRVAVLKDHVPRHFVTDLNRGVNYRLFVLDVASERESRALTESFRGSRPPVICGMARIIYGDRRISLDRVTGERVMVFRVSVTSFTPTTAQVTSSSYTSDTGGEYFNYTLIRTNGQWRIMAREYNGES
jgi:hypothetical protein